MAATVVGLHVLGLVLLFTAVSRHYHLSTKELFGVGTGILAYALGMRHAFDADHISAIDNTTRKLMGEGKRPLSVGFWFSLGHSTIVFGLAVTLIRYPGPQRSGAERQLRAPSVDRDRRTSVSGSSSISSPPSTS